MRQAIKYTEKNKRMLNSEVFWSAAKFDRRCLYARVLSFLFAPFFFFTSFSSASELPRYYDLPDLAKQEVENNPVKAQELAEELLRLSSSKPKDWNYGNAIHIGNMVLGQVALRKGNVKEAERYLLESGDTPGSPQLDTFGPNMSLAKELLEANRIDTVLEYFERCSQFWELSGDKLEVWSTAAKNGEIPDFGANLFY